MLRYSLLPLLLFITASSAIAQPRPCTATREYVTVLEFLRTQKQLELPDPESRRVADQASTGCTGAGLRFIQTFELVSRSGVGGNDAVKLALEMAAHTDAQAKAFTTVFRRAFLSEDLDLELGASVDLARELSTGFTGDAAGAEKDFNALTGFCLGKRRGVEMPKIDCASFAARLTKIGASYPQGVYRPFTGLLDFLRESSAGPRVATYEALKLTEKILAQGQEGPTNFEQAYRYAASRQGLQLAGADALLFAEKLASRSQALAQSAAEPAAKP